eukprot:6177477-Pleurochrysis_carterae.AAC.1
MSPTVLFEIVDRESCGGADDDQRRKHAHAALRLRLLRLTTRRVQVGWRGEYKLARGALLRAVGKNAEISQSGCEEERNGSLRERRARRRVGRGACELTCEHVSASVRAFVLARSCACRRARARVSLCVRACGCTRARCCRSPTSGAELRRTPPTSRGDVCDQSMLCEDEEERNDEDGDSRDDCPLFAELTQRRRWTRIRRFLSKSNL